METILSRNGDLFWVDQATGSDSNPGTKSRPWKTISRANKAGQLTPGDAVLIRAGTYREGIRPRAAGAAGRLITFSAYPGEVVTVSGSDVVNRPGSGYTGWKAQSDGSWRHAWVWDVLPSEGSPLADRRRELFAVNGDVLRQLSGTSRPTVGPGQFWVQGNDKAPTAVYLRTKNNADPNKQFVEVGQRNQLFQPDSRDVCTRSEDGYYRVLLLRFTHSTAKRQRMAVCTGSRGSRIEEIETIWNNAGGIQLTGSDHLVRGIVSSDNGTEGVGAQGCDRCTVEYSEFRGNHWKWWQDEGGRSHGGGGKITGTTNSTFRFNTYADNEGAGIWLDENASGNEIYGNRVSNNLKQGIQIELHSDDNRIYNNVVTGTRYYSSIWNGIGISISVSARNLVAYNTVLSNNGTGIRVGGDNRGVSSQTTVYNNLFVNNALAAEAGRDIMVLGSGSSSTRSPWELVNTNRINGNGYTRRNPNDVQPNEANFMVSPSGLGVGALYSNTLSEWQQPAGFDTRGLITNPSKPTFVNANNLADGWRLSASSQYDGRAVALPQGIDPIRTDVFGNPRPASGGSIGAHELGSGTASPAPPGPSESSDVVFAVNAGGKAFTAADGTVYQADALFSSGRPRSTNAAIAGTTDDALYKTARAGQFSYSVPLPPGTYEITLKFAEFVYDGSNQRRFDVRAEGDVVATDIDIFARAGANTAYDRTVTVVVTDGTLDLRFLQDLKGPTISAMTVRSTTVAPAPPSGEVVFAVNAGGKAFTADDGTAYRADALFTGGRLRNTTAPIAGTSDDGLYKTARAGQFGYDVPVPNGTYRVTLRFAEFVYDGADQRLFDVQMEGVEVITDLDLYGTVGANTAYDQIVTVVVRDGVLNARFLQDRKGPTLSAMTVQAFNTKGADGGAATAAETSAKNEAQPLALSPAAPNPTRATATLRYTIPEASEVRIDVLDVLGRSVAVLADERQEPGDHAVTFDGTQLPSGVYVIRLQADSQTAVQRLTLTR